VAGRAFLGRDAGLGTGFAAGAVRATREVTFCVLDGVRLEEEVVGAVIVARCTGAGAGFALLGVAEGLPVSGGSGDGASGMTTAAAELLASGLAALVVSTGPRATSAVALTGPSV